MTQEHIVPRGTNAIASSDAAVEDGLWQYPLDLTSAIVVRRRPGYATFHCSPRHTFAAATPAWGLSRDDLAAALSMVGDRMAADPARAALANASANEEQGRSPKLEAASARAQDLPQLSALKGTLAQMGQAQEEGIAERFVDLLRHEVIPPVPNFRVLRLVPPPEARGERPIADERASSVVVGERVVVTWVREIVDGPHIVPQTLAHLDALDYLAVPETHGVLLWTTPSGREVPVAWATKYLPRARDGWDWCLDLAQNALGVLAPTTPGAPGVPISGSTSGQPSSSISGSTSGQGAAQTAGFPGAAPPTPIRGTDPWTHDFPTRLGAFAAKLHLALATASKVVPQPVITAPEDLVRAWHRAAVERVEAAAAIARAGSLDGVQEVLLPRLGSLRAAVDRMLLVAQEVEAGTRVVTTQRIHGDLHVGQVLRWSGGLVVVDFHPHPVVEVDGLAVGQPLQPAARDLARLLRSLDHVGRVVDKTTDFAVTERVDAWSERARADLTRAYRDELAAAGRLELLDEDLVAAFEAEQLCREIAYADEFVNSWVYAPLGGVWQSYPPDDEGPSTPRHA